jgi:hypothetical protein
VRGGGGGTGFAWGGGGAGRSGTERLSGKRPYQMNIISSTFLIRK